MFRTILCCFLLSFLSADVFAREEFTPLKDLRNEWMTFQEGTYRPLAEMPFRGLNTIYLQLDPQTHAGHFLRVTSADQYYLFVNGKIRGEYEGTVVLRVDSLLRTENRVSWIAVHQQNINERDLITEIVSRDPPRLADEKATAARPYSSFRDFVVISGLVIILLFLVAFRMNPKLAADYFSVSRIFASRDPDDSQASARLTGGSNVQFYLLCSLMAGFYMLIVLNYLPREYALPLRFQAASFGMMWVRWIELSAIIFLALLLKIFIIFSLTRLFDMRGMVRFHFFNWIRLLLVILGAATVFLFFYFISRGDDPDYYELFLGVLVAVLIGWIVVAFFKLSGKTGHSMFHLFSYLCATEIIPLLITVKVLFQ